MRFVTMSALVASAMALAACAGSGSAALTPDDVIGVLELRPTVPAGSRWTAGTRAEQSALDFRRTVRADLAAAVDALLKNGLERRYAREWVRSDSAGSTAEGRALSFRDSAGAHAGFGRVHDLTPNWMSDLSAEDLGEESAGGRSETGAGFTWRRENVVFSAHVFGDGGPAFDFVAAARAYARALDEAAQAR